jgi:hypothetical protein
MPRFASVGGRVDGLCERQTPGEGRSMHELLAKRERWSAFEGGMAQPRGIVIRLVDVGWEEGGCWAGRVEDEIDSSLLYV